MASPTVLVLSDPRAPFLQALDSLSGEPRLVVTADREHALRVAPEAEILLTATFKPDLAQAAIPAARRLKWVHSLAAGVEPLLLPEILESAIVLTNGRGAYARPLGEWALLAALYFFKFVPQRLAEQRARRWNPADVDELHGKTLGIVGYGQIGRACAERARPFGMRVLGLRRRPELSPNDPLLDAVYGPPQLHELIARSDVLVLAAPNTPQTAGMIGAREIGLMRPNAVLINVGRGSLVDEPALVEALRARRILGAGLDVFATEPLPPASPLWDLDNVLLSPHTADRTPGWLDRAIEVFVRNYEKYRRGEELENIVDKQAGY
jgi:phosphoglycerate dehydrogenase-like enzyme